MTLSTAKDLVRTHNGLTEQQGRFIHALLASGDKKAAYLDAGYSDAGKNTAQKSATLLRQPMVVAALHAELGRQLAVDAVIARRVAMGLLLNTDLDERGSWIVSAKTKADLAIKIMRIAGHVEPRAAIADNGPVKTLSEMSTEELRSRAEQLEEEIAARARPINAVPSANPVPDDTEIIDIVE